MSALGVRRKIAAMEDATKFRCPTCESEYLLVRVEAAPFWLRTSPFGPPHRYYHVRFLAALGG
jgi:hypothetical protein